jgi:cation transport ATPase
MERGIRPAFVQEACAVPGCGIRGHVAGHLVAAGSNKWMAELGLEGSVDLARKARGLNAAGTTLVCVGWAGRVRGVVALGDALLPERCRLHGCL